jgi:hypothetical protein
MSFPDADPWDAEGYAQIIAQWKSMLEGNPLINCKDVKIREILTIGTIDDYEDWRALKGEYARSPNPNIQGVTYPVPPVDPLDVARVWEAMAAPRKPGDISVAQICQQGANVQAVMARCIFLSVMREEGHLPGWETDPARADAILKHAATFPLDKPDQKTAVLFMSTLPVS